MSGSEQRQSVVAQFELSHYQTIRLLGL
ncbi:hypothetical protein SBA2_240020 [Acidobacteriia bacterium SbA2]|nr:hypothetical protein SBA2_240020 [Acidobacteriia bacterium SbA2]